MKDCRVVIQKLADEMGVSVGSAHCVMRENMCKWKVSAEFVQSWTVEQKKTAAFGGPTRHSERHLLNTVITSDELWVYGYGPEMKCQSFHNGSTTHHRGQKSRCTCCHMHVDNKVILIIFFY